MAATALTLAALVGSLRAGSHHRRLLELAGELLPAHVDLVEAPLREVPFYDQDLEDAGAPAEVERLRATVGDAAGLLVFTPEYNRSIPGVVKNAVDWLSRPFLAGALLGTPVGIVSATPGRHDAAGGREHLAASAASTGAAVFEPTLGLASVTRRFAPGEPVDHELQVVLEEWLGGFVRFVEATRAEAPPGSAG
jgi:NAD(P)H-dependent FMN reductase